MADKPTVEFYNDEDGVTHVRVDRPGVAAVSARVDPEAAIRELADKAGLVVEVRAQRADEAAGDGGA